MLSTMQQARWSLGCNMSLKKKIEKFGAKPPTIKQMRELNKELTLDEQMELRQLSELGLCPWDKKPGWDKVI